MWEIIAEAGNPGADLLLRIPLLNLLLSLINSRIVRGKRGEKPMDLTIQERGCLTPDQPPPWCTLMIIKLYINYKFCCNQLPVHLHPISLHLPHQITTNWRPRPYNKLPPSLYYNNWRPYNKSGRLQHKSWKKLTFPPIYKLRHSKDQLQVLTCIKLIEQNFLISIIVVMAIWL